VGQELGWDVAALRATFGDDPSLSLDAPQPGADDALTALDLLEDARTPDPLAALAARQRHALLAEMVRHLPQREQQVLALSYVEEMTMLETGRALGIGESRVSQLHARAVTRLRSVLSAWPELSASRSEPPTSGPPRSRRARETA
jgi:RNA polymerase sigma factor for flagellar operon FliA